MKTLGRHLLLAAALLFTASPGLAADPRYQQEADELARVRQQIQAIQKELSRHEASRSGIASELRSIEKEVGRIMGKLRHLEQQHARKSSRVAVLQREFEAEERRMQQQREQLRKQLISAYAGGGADRTFLKLLFNQEDPSRFERMLAYHRYFNRARMEQIGAAVGQMQRLLVMRRSLEEEIAELEEVRASQERERQALAAARAERTRTLKSLERAIAGKEEQLGRLRSDETRLQGLLQELREALADIPAHGDAGAPFRSRRGKLDWPMEGALAARFGQPRGIGDMRWSGVLIQGKEGGGVRAVSRGHVVFADWLRGFGLLLIIDHGDGFMTLYGHNEAIYKEAGDWVQAGDIIATVGASGGRPEAGLYFEIRADGKPVDPLVWLRPKRDA